MLRSRSNAAHRVDRIEVEASKMGVKKREKKQANVNGTPSISTILFCAISFAITCFVASISYSNFLRNHHELHHHSKHSLRGKMLNENILPNSIVPELDEPIPTDSIYNLEYPTMKHHGELFPLSTLVGKIAIVINVACACGKTGLTYKHIKTMLEKYSSGENGQAGVIDGEERDNNLVILAFPTNDFHQEPGTNEEIEETVKGLLGEQYDNENFILFHKSKLEHNPIYKMLKKHMPEAEVKHNFYKYIIGRDGVPIAFYKKSDTLLDMESAIIDELESI